MYIENLVAQCTSRCNRLCALNHQVRRVQIQTEYIGIFANYFAQLIEGAHVVNQCAWELLDGNALDAVFLCDAAGFFPPCSSGFPLILDAFLHVGEAVKIRP